MAICILKQFVFLWFIEFAEFPSTFKLTSWNSKSKLFHQSSYVDHCI